MDNRADPHDQLMLTERPCTIVTQHTAMHDSMPDPYGDQDEEEALFSDVGDDTGLTQNASAQAAQAASVTNRMPGVEVDPQSPTAVSQGVSTGVKSGATSILTVLAVGLGIGFLLRRI